MKFKTYISLIPNHCRLAYFRWVAWYTIMQYNLKHSAFTWKVDKDGDICFRLFWVFNFTKYKDGTIIKLGMQKMSPAPKYVRGVHSGMV